MVRIHKRLWSVITLLIIAAFALSACGGGENPTATPASGGTSATATTSTGGTTNTTPTTGAESTVVATQAPSGNTGGPTLKDPNTLVEAAGGDAESLDPAWEYDTTSAEVVQSVYETLLFMNREHTDQFVPMLAAKMPDISSDGKTYTWTIRKGVKFQDGSDLTPEDVAYSFWRGMIQDRASGPQWIMLQPFFGLDVQRFKDDVVTKQNGGDWNKACSALQQAITFDNNAGTVTMKLKAPYGPMLQILTGSWASIVSKKWSTAQGDWDGNCANAEKFNDPKAEDSKLFKTMNGTGPFKLDRWAPGEEIDLVRNDNYWQTTPMWQGAPTGPAKLQRVVIKDMKEWGTRFAAFKAGDVDIVQVDQQYISQVDPFVKETCDANNKCTPGSNANGFVRLWKGLPQSTNGAVFFNEKVNTTGGNQRIGSGKLDGNGIPPTFFSDINIRKAFNYAFDWDTFIKQVYNGEAIQALGPIPQGVLGFDPNQAHYSFDLQKATDAFKAAAPIDGKSVWDTGFTIQYVYNSGNDQRKVAGEILQNSLQQINPKFKLQVSDEPWPAFLKESTDGRLGLYYLGWQEDFHDPHDWVFPYLSSGGTYAATQAFPADVQKQLDDLVTKAVQSTDQAERAKLYGQLQNMTYENALDLFAIQPVGREYQQMWVQGWYFNPIYPANAGQGNYYYVLSKSQQ